MCCELVCVGQPLSKTQSALPTNLVPPVGMALIMTTKKKRYACGSLKEDHTCSHFHSLRERRVISQQSGLKGEPSKSCDLRSLLSVASGVICDYSSGLNTLLLFAEPPNLSGRSEASYHLYRSRFSARGQRSVHYAMQHLRK
jgi:hypothetical protein